MTTLRLWHGGVPDLGVGGLLIPGQKRKTHEGCAFCAARSKGMAVMAPDGSGIDPPSAHQDRIYLTTDREYARFHASLWGRGDLYQVEAIGELAPSTEDPFESFIATSAIVRVVYARAVLLTWSQRNALNKRWTDADKKRSAS